MLILSVCLNSIWQLRVFKEHLTYCGIHWCYGHVANSGIYTQYIMACLTLSSKNFIPSGDYFRTFHQPPTEQVRNMYHLYPSWLSNVPETRWCRYNLQCDIIRELQYIPRNIHTVFALLCFVVVIHWLIFPYPSGLLHWHCGNLTIAPVPAKQPWWIWINTSCKFIMNDCITTTKQSTTKPCAYFLGYTVCARFGLCCGLAFVYNTHGFQMIESVPLKWFRIILTMNHTRPVYYN